MKVSLVAWFKATVLPRRFDWFDRQEEYDFQEENKQPKSRQPSCHLRTEITQKPTSERARDGSCQDVMLILDKRKVKHRRQGSYTLI